MEWNNYSYSAHKGDFFWQITRRYIFQFTKYERKGVSESIDFNDTSFSSVGLVE